MYLWSQIVKTQNYYELINLIKYYPNLIETKLHESIIQFKEKHVKGTQGTNVLYSSSVNHTIDLKSGIKTKKPKMDYKDSPTLNHIIIIWLYSSV